MMTSNFWSSCRSSAFMTLRSRVGDCCLAMSIMAGLKSIPTLFLPWMEASSSPVPQPISSTE